MPKGRTKGASAAMKEFFITQMNAEGNPVGKSILVTAPKNATELKRVVLNRYNLQKVILMYYPNVETEDGLLKKMYADKDSFIKGTHYIGIQVPLNCDEEYEYFWLVEDIEEMSKANNRVVGSLS